MRLNRVHQDLLCRLVLFTLPPGKKGVVEDPRIYERACADAGAIDYEKGQWEMEYKYFVAGRWGRKFTGLFLDFGCGTGIVSRNLVAVGREVIATDISRNMIALAKRKCGVPVVVADGLHLPFKDRAFSVICVSGVLHHLPQQLEEAFAELERCSSRAICIIEPSSTPPPMPLRILLFFDKAYGWLIFQMISKHRRNKYKFSIYEEPLDPKKLEKLCVKKGFKIRELRFFNHIPKLHKVRSESFKKHLINSLISSSSGSDVEIIAERSN